MQAHTLGRGNEDVLISSEFDTINRSGYLQITVNSQKNVKMAIYS